MIANNQFGTEMKGIVYIQDHEIFSLKDSFYHPKSEHFFDRYLAGLTESERLIVYSGQREATKLEDVKRYKNVSHPRIEYRALPNFRKVRNLPRMWKIVKNAVKEADYCYLRPGISTVIAWYYCRKWNKPYLAIVTGDVKKAASQNSKPFVRLASIPLGFGVKRMIKNANAALYVTQNYLQKQYSCLGKTLGCSDVEHLKIDSNNLDYRLNKIASNHKTIVLGSVGSVAATVKGHDTVIRALAKLRCEGYNNYIYQVVGTGDSKRLRTLAESLHVDDIVQFLGEYSHDDVLSWFNNVDIYLHPSRSEGLPRTILEAMTKAVPCICSSVGGIPELIGKECLFDYDGSEVSKVYDLITKMTPEYMRKYAIINFEHSKEYDHNRLSRIRKVFLTEMLSEWRCKKSDI